MTTTTDHPIKIATADTIELKRTTSSTNTTAMKAIIQATIMPSTITTAAGANTNAKPTTPTTTHATRDERVNSMTRKPH